MFQKIFKKALPHVLSVLIFLVLSLVYFQPQMDGYRLKQGDIMKHKGMSKDIQDHRALYDEEPLWTGGMFAGMPATQTSVVYRWDVLKQIDTMYSLWLKRPAKYIFMYMLGFYILLIILKADPWLAASGAIAYGFSSYFFVIMEAGHNSKAHAVAYLAPLLGSILLVFQGKTRLGLALTALFMALELKANHVQVTYYLMFVILGVGIYYFIEYAKQKRYADFAKVSGMLIGAVLIGILPNVANLYGTYEFTPHTIRGGSDLTISPEGKEVEKRGGLAFDYITEWSYGIDESWTFMIPDAKGGSSKPIAYEEADRDLIAESDLNNEERATVMNISRYWGDQSITGGPVYIGAVVCTLFVLALFMYSNPFKWVLLIVTLLVLALSWGKNYPSLTKLFIDIFPMYSKFRAVTIILIIAELTIPLLAFLWLKDALKKNDFKENYSVFGKELNVKKYWVYIGAGVLLIATMFMFAPSSDSDFLSKEEKLSQDVNHNIEVLEQRVISQFGSIPEGYGELIQKQAEETAVKAQKNNAVSPKIRKAIYKRDFNRSLGFVVATLVLVFAFLWFKWDYRIFAGALTLIVLVDLWPVAQRYINSEAPDPAVTGGADRNEEYDDFRALSDVRMPYSATPADLSVLSNEINENNALVANIEESIAGYEGNGEDLPAPLNSMMTAQRVVQGPNGGGQLAKMPVPVKITESLAFRTLNTKTHYRVLNAGSGLVSDGTTAYFHKSIGGYHGAKLSRFQDLIVWYLADEQGSVRNPQNAQGALANANILNMLNTKYIIYNPGAPAIPNPNANGNAWFVKGFEEMEGANEEILGLNGLNTKDTAIFDKRFADYLKGWDLQYDSDASIDLTEYKLNHMTYEVDGLDTDQLAVFSEIYYPLGWQAYVDGKKVDHIRVNYTLRGLRIPAGTKKVEFKYELASYGWTTTVSLIGSLLVLILVGWVVYSELKQMRLIGNKA